MEKCFNMYFSLLFQYTIAFFVIWSLTSMLDKGLLSGVSDDEFGIPIWCAQVGLEIAGILFTMILEGILGRRQCLILYATMIFLVSIFVDMAEKSPMSMMSYKSKDDMEKISRCIIFFFFGPIKSLIILFTLSVYPTSMR